MQKLFYFTVHFLFWTTFVALSWMSVSSSTEELGFLSANSGAPMLLLSWGAVNFYSFYFYFQPLLLDKKKYIGYLLVSVAFCVIASALFVGMFWQMYPAFRAFAMEKFLQGIVGTFLISQCGSLLRGFISWNQNLQNRTALENQSLRNELAMLKAQLSPHFLFNTLNNIDTLIYKSQETASSMLIKLGSLLRYMLYESDSKEVPIRQEVEYIEQLVALQQMRFEEPDYIELKIDQRESEGTIAPLLFLPFIENAFKFVSQPAAMPAIRIHLEVTKDRVHLMCKNYYSNTSPSHKGKHQGIGLANARRRLELLYPNAFDLQVSNNHQFFLVDLTITNT